MSKGLQIYHLRSYKEAIRERLRLLKKIRPQMTLSRLADLAQIQYTYLSMILKTEKGHLTEDQLFRVAHHLEFFEDEIDFLFLLRSLQSSQDEKRKKSLLHQVERFERERNLSAEHQKVSVNSYDAQTQYLLSPLCLVVHMALFIKAYRQDPSRLCAPLGIKSAQLKKILQILEMNDFVQLSRSGEVSAVKANRMHFGKDHPLMRTAQILNRTFASQKLNSLDESEKESHNYTFTMDKSGFDEVRSKFNAFLQEVQKTAVAKQKQEHVYQLTLDFFRWF